MRLFIPVYLKFRALPCWHGVQPRTVRGEKLGPPRRLLQLISAVSVVPVGFQPGASMLAWLAAQAASGRDAAHTKVGGLEKIPAVWVGEEGELAPVVGSCCALMHKHSDFGVFSRPLLRSTSRPWCRRRMTIVAGSSRRKGGRIRSSSSSFEKERSDNYEYPLQLCEALAGLQVAEEGLASAQSVDAALARFEAGGRRLRRPPPL
ncbi:hypothetical protein DFH08DRAFT_803487 [Mycena albidolilacea]|uniref:Uncharacterized protein n=1 Tax=Mycena albidolilacea TaxID=1033008 RepID=A0AAD7ADE0_9AGAR|nr:hypothetical protein DFH08DRAFT_803487 [Mycena albidolilacea]